MQRMIKGLLVLTLVVGASLPFDASAAAACCNDNNNNCCDTDCANICGDGHAYFSIRSQSINAARDLVGWQGHINKFEMEKIYGAFYILPEYTRSFKPSRIAGFLFGEDYKTGNLAISGSRKGSTTFVARGANEWLADYFGLPTDFESTVNFCPRISNFMVDLGLYLGFDEAWEGGYFRIHAPIVYTKWALNANENVVKEGALGFDAGYMDHAVGTDAAATINAIPNTDLKKSWLSAMDGTHTWGDMKEALQYGKIDANCCNRTKTRLSDIEMALGWNFVQDEDYHFGLLLRASAPTGNKPDARFLFEPIVGSGGHWMLGGGLTGHADLWTSDDEESTLSIFVDANVGHYFKAKQMRSFDLTGKTNSRYVLIQEMGTTVADLYQGATGVGSAISTSQYQGNLFPLINKSTCCTDVSIAVQGDLAIKFAWVKNNWCVDLGYNLWGRSGEKFKDDCCTSCCLSDSKKWSLKGDAFVSGFQRNAITARTLAATQSLADVHGGKNTPTGTAYVAAHKLNPSIDSAALAWDAVNNDRQIKSVPAVNDDALQLNTSSTPKFITCDDLNTCKTPAALSHKVFLHVNYNWVDEGEEQDEWIPFLGLGGEVEFAGKTDGNYSAVSQWGVWLKGGLAFN